MVSGDHLGEFHAALAKFLENTDPKAALLASLAYVQAIKGVSLPFYRILYSKFNEDVYSIR